MKFFIGQAVTGEDLGDVLILLSNFASMNGIDLEKSFINKIESVNKKHLGESL